MWHELTYEAIAINLFVDKEIDLSRLFEEVKFPASLWASMEKFLKDFPFSLII